VHHDHAVHIPIEILTVSTIRVVGGIPEEDLHIGFADSRIVVNLSSDIRIGDNYHLRKLYLSKILKFKFSDDKHQEHTPNSTSPQVDAACCEGPHDMLKVDQRPLNRGYPKLVSPDAISSGSRTLSLIFPSTLDK
jgi:hypothetical protein